MQAALISAIVKVLMSVLTEELLKDFADTVLDFIENKVMGTASKVDDALVLPVVKTIRSVFNIPDGDD